jgi:ABC-type uncharacterized transport system involved in gliding motility auxiliary subunit
MQFIQAQLEYETVWVDLATEKRVPRDLACLIVLEANTLKERELYEIERYLAEGGNVVMMVQGWSTNLEVSGSFASGTMLTKADTQPHFEDWAKHIGVQFGSELLLRENARLQPYQVVGGGFQRRVQPIDTAVNLAPIVEPQDLNTDSVFTRGLASLSMPLPVETKLNDERLGALELQRTDLITPRGTSRCTTRTTRRLQGPVASRRAAPPPRFRRSDSRPRAGCNARSRISWGWRRPTGAPCRCGRR